MKTLTIMRHADAESAKYGEKDIHRKLSEKGHSEVKLLTGFYSKVYAETPDRLEVSPARRTLETAEYFRKIWGVSYRGYQVNENIYEASVSQLLDIIHGWDDSIQRGMIVGHNPSLLSLINLLIDHRPLHNLPPAGLAILQSDAEWEDWKSCSASLRIFTSPEKLSLQG